MKSETVLLPISPIAVDDLKFMLNINPVSVSVALIVATLALNGLIQIEYIWKQRLKKNGKILSQWKWSFSTSTFNKCSIGSEYHKVLFSVALWKLSIYNGITQWIHLRQFAINWTSKFHVESSWKLHPLWKANPRGKYDVDSKCIFRRRFDFPYRGNIDEFSTWIFLYCFDVKST